MLPWVIAALKIARNNAQGQQNQANSLNYNMNSTPAVQNQQSSGVSNALGTIGSIFGQKPKVPKNDEENLWQK